MKTALPAIFCLVFSAFGARADDFTGVKSLDLRVASGNVSVTGVDTGVASVSVVKKRYDERCHLEISRRGETLLVVLESRSLFNARCEADFTLKLPRATALKFKDGSGDITVEGMTGSLSAESGSGKIEAKGLRSPASIRTGSGAVRVAYETVPANGAVEIRTGSGSAEVLFPRKSKVRTHFRAGSGTLKNTLGDCSECKGAAFTVSMKSGSGDLTVGNL